MPLDAYKYSPRHSCCGRHREAELWGLFLTPCCPTGSSQEAQSYNRLRECIRQLFPERKCFVFDQPAWKKDLPRLEELPDDMLDPEFQQQVERFCSYIWQNCPPKTIPGGRKITGSSEYRCPEGPSSWDCVGTRLRCRAKGCWRWHRCVFVPAVALTSGFGAPSCRVWLEKS